MSEWKSKQVFEQPLYATDEPAEALKTTQSFDEQETFVPVTSEEAAQEQEQLEPQWEPLIRPSRRSWRWGTGLLSLFVVLIGWQALDSVWLAWQQRDWLALGWSAFTAGLGALGVAAVGKELWKLRRLKRHFSVQEQSEALIQQDSVGHGKAFCQQLAKEAHIPAENPTYDRWLHQVQDAHSDAEILDMYDAMVVAEQDKRATIIVSRYATESAALVAISPLAIADMCLVAWRNFKMVDQLAQIYGVELGYWSRIRLLKAVFVNMALAGASELAIDAGMDLLSMDLAGRLSARAGQGVGVGILTARLGLKAMALLRPIPWHPERAIKLSSIRKQIVAKVTALTLKS